MDPHCFVDHFNTLTLITQSTNVLLQKQQHMISDMRNEQHAERIVKEDLYATMYKMSKSIERIENYIMSASEPVSKPSHPKGILRFSVSSKGLAN